MRPPGARNDVDTSPSARVRSAVEAGVLTAPSAYLVFLFSDATWRTAAVTSFGVVVVLALLSVRVNVPAGDVVAAFVALVRRALLYNAAFWCAVLGVALLGFLDVGSGHDAMLVSAMLTALVVWGPHVVST